MTDGRFESIWIPDGPATKVRARAHAAIDEFLASRDKEFRETMLCLESDRALREWAARNVSNFRVVRAFQFGGEIPWRHEIAAFAWCQDDERRPVVARASREVLFEKYAFSLYSRAPGGWYYSVLLRYLRMTKYTCFDNIEHHDNITKIMCRPDNWQKHRMSPGIANRISWLREGTCWINGKEKHGLDEHQLHYLRKLWDLSQKIKATDQLRMAA